MRYVVTGGSGFVGSHLVKRLEDHGKDILVIDKISNHSNLNTINYKNNTRYYFADISDPEIALKIIQKEADINSADLKVVLVKHDLFKSMEELQRKSDHILDFCGFYE